MNHETDPATDQAAHWLAQLEHALTQSDLAATPALFADECYWRDLVAFTWNIVTMSLTSKRHLLAISLSKSNQRTTC